MLKALDTRVTTRTTFKGHLDSYRFCDQVLLAGCADGDLRVGQALHASARAACAVWHAQSEPMTLLHL